MNLTYSSTPTFFFTQWKVLDNVKIVENEEKQIQVKKGKWKFDKGNKKYININFIYLILVILISLLFYFILNE